VEGERRGARRRGHHEDVMVPCRFDERDPAAIGRSAKSRQVVGDRWTFEPSSLAVRCRHC
jgi:hypothetical protein